MTNCAVSAELHASHGDRIRVPLQVLHNMPCRATYQLALGVIGNPGFQSTRILYRAQVYGKESDSCQQERKYHKQSNHHPSFQSPHPAVANVALLLLILLSARKIQSNGVSLLAGDSQQLHSPCKISAVLEEADGGDASGAGMEAI